MISWVYQFGKTRVINFINLIFQITDRMALNKHGSSTQEYPGLTAIGHQ